LGKVADGIVLVGEPSTFGFVYADNFANGIFGGTLALTDAKSTATLTTTI
jgi:hypothetical protein